MVFVVDLAPSASMRTRRLGVCLISRIVEFMSDTVKVADNPQKFMVMLVQRLAKRSFRKQ